ncbi:MAG: hypothetical protein DME40_16245 [Verrucomicrobia bacterium]|nr:MAG: hypothetical protein DME37_08100 [Verrucomicrobiota bacterium]PYK86490.1 MAG: hypothetical protein DME40_16245 [Verrucomicrobiota bacterium]PYL75571.1 MAG: hypothetical protein DMF27_11600 [Verrucomicrobiota bacterium]
MFFHRSLLLEVRTFAVVPLLVLALSSPWGRGRRAELFVMWSSDDPSLRTQIAALSPTVSPDEARRVAYTTYMTGRELHREWRVAWLPGIQNFLVNMGARKGGLCFQWATELLVRLDALKLQTLELHWAESGANTGAEHNVIVVTARGQAFGEGILLDLWRYSGSLVWAHVGMDPDYRWTENKSELARRLGGTRDVASKQVRSTTKSN